MITAVIKNIKQAKDIKDLVDAYIAPIKDFSINYENTFELKDIKQLKDYKKQIFLAVNKNIHNNELEDLKILLKEIETLNIDGIIFYDIALVNLKKKLNLKTPLVWAQEHLTTNYQTINYWNEKDAKFAYLSSELTKKEMDEIKKQTNSKLFVNVFGYLPMFTSRRHLVTNYLQYFNLKDNNKSKSIYKEEKYYPISDNKHGTTVYSDYILNALDENFKEYDYLVFNSNLISDNDFKDTLIKYKDNKSNYKFPFNHGFLNKETIYKVKKNA